MLSVTEAETPRKRKAGDGLVLIQYVAKETNGGRSSPHLSMQSPSTVWWKLRLQKDNKIAGTSE